MVVAGDGLQDQGRLASRFDTVYATTAAGPIMNSDSVLSLFPIMYIYNTSTLFDSVYVTLPVSLAR